MTSYLQLRTLVVGVLVATYIQSSSCSTPPCFGDHIFTLTYSYTEDGGGSGDGESTSSCVCTYYEDCNYDSGQTTICGPMCSEDDDCTEGWTCQPTTGEDGDECRCRPVNCDSNSDCPTVDVAGTSVQLVCRGLTNPPGLCMLDPDGSDRQGCPCLPDLTTSDIGDCPSSSKSKGKGSKSKGKGSKSKSKGKGKGKSGGTCKSSKSKGKGSKSKSKGK